MGDASARVEEDCRFARVAFPSRGSNDWTTLSDPREDGFPMSFSYWNSQGRPALVQVPSPVATAAIGAGPRQQVGQCKRPACCCTQCTHVFLFRPYPPWPACIWSRPSALVSLLPILVSWRATIIGGCSRPRKTVNRTENW